MAGWRLAQVNIGRMLRPAGDPQVAGFLAALTRLWMLERCGPTPHVFTFKPRFPAPGLAGPPIGHQPNSWCVGNA